jgi:hypothetical protein
VSEFDNLRNEGEQYAKDHPQQVHEAEQDAENAVKSKLDPDGGRQQDDQQNQVGDHDPGASQQDQGQQSQQGNAQQGQNS